MHHVSKQYMIRYTNCIGVHEKKIFVQNTYIKKCKISNSWSCLAKDQDSQLNYLHTCKQLT